MNLFNRRITSETYKKIPLSADARLTADIDLTKADGKPTEWKPIGDYNGGRYTGTFDGAGHTVKGYRINKADEMGFFCTVGGGGTVRGLTVSGDINIEDKGNPTYAGGVAGNCFCTIEGCVNAASLTSSANNVIIGGIVGHCRGGTISNCVNSGDIANNSDYGTGGIAGNDKDDKGGTISNCLNSGNVENSGRGHTGGIAGHNYNGSKISNCLSSGGKITGGENVTGGVAGVNEGGSTISNCGWLKTDTVNKGVGNNRGEENTFPLDNKDKKVNESVVALSADITKQALNNGDTSRISLSTIYGNKDDFGKYVTSIDAAVSSPDILSAVVSGDSVILTAKNDIGMRRATATVTLSPDLHPTDFDTMEPSNNPSDPPLKFTFGVTVTTKVDDVVISGDVVSPLYVNDIIGHTRSLRAIVSPDYAADKTVTWDSLNRDIVSVNETVYVRAIKRGEATITATAGGKSDDCHLTVLQKIEGAELTLSPDVFVYDGREKEPKVTVIVSGETLSQDTDYTADYKNNTGAGEATAIVTGKGFCVGTVSKDLTILPKPASPDVTDNTRTDGEYSGVLVVEPNTTEEFAIYDAFDRLNLDNTLPDNISADAQAVQPGSADISTDITSVDMDEVREAIGRYWNLAPTSPDRMRIVSVLDTVAKDKSPEPPKTVWGKIWAYISKGGNNNGANDFGNGKYLPLQTNFTITSADIAALPQGIREGLTKDNFLERISLFAAVTSGDSGTSGGAMEARALNDVASSDKYIMVTKDDHDGSYKIKTRLLLFNREGKVTNGPGAPFVMAADIQSGDKTTREGNYFIVEDGKTDDRYQVTMAFAVKEANSASVSLTVSGDIEPKLVSWIISGDTVEHRGNTSADITAGEQRVSIKDMPGGYHVTLSDGSQALSPDVRTITNNNVDWGGKWNILAEFSKITANSVTLDKNAVALPVGGSCTITAAVEPQDAYGGVSWASSSSDIAAILPINDKNATITAAAAGTTTITAKARAGDKSASCTVTVRKSADEGGGLKPLAPGTVKPNIDTTDCGPIPVKPEYITDLAKQDEAMKKIKLAFDDAALMEKGELVISGGLVNKAADEVISDDTEIISKDTVIYLPLVESRAAEAGKTHALGFTVSGDLFGEIDDISQIRVIKIFPDGTGKPFRVATKAEEIENKTVALYDADDNIVTGAIEPETEYTLAVFIKDGGEYDLDSEEDGTVIDPIAISPPCPSRPRTEEAAVRRARARLLCSR
ncbi:MAG: Ig-like domain-containing protein [Synergistaceae bacterium]|nr:Ig-like domain-containing protein [Synergistaceae bacterium]